MTRTLRLLTVCFAMVLGLTTVGLSAAQATDTTIATGTVRANDTGQPISGVTVKVYASEDAANAATGALETETSDEFGFSIQQVDDNYWLGFVDSTGTYSGLVQEVVVNAGDTNLGDFYLDPLIGSASGTIVDHDGVAIDDQCTEIDFYNATGAESDGSVQTTYADESGHYNVGLKVGSYKVVADDNCDNLPVSWAGGVDFSTASTVTVTADHNTVVPAIKISAGASITGIVKDGSGNPISGILVESYASDPDIDGFSIATSYTNASGHFSLQGHQPGTYKVKFSDPSHEYSGEWYADGATFGTGTPVVVTNDTDIPLALTTLATVPPSLATKVLSGKVVNVLGANVFGITVRADGDGSATTTTRRDGTYSFIADDLGPGSYKLSFDDDFGVALGQARYLSQYYLGKDTYSSATPITVTAGAHAVTTVKLVGYGSVTGTVTVPAELTQRDLSVAIYDEDDQVVQSTDTASTGAYEFTGLAPGAYKLRFTGSAYGDDTSADFIGQWFKNKSTFASATVVTVKDLAATSSISVTLTDQLTALALPRISGITTKGSTLKTSTGTWNRVTDTVYAYQWYRGTSAISGAAKSSYKLGSSDVGKTIKVKVTASNRYDRYRSGSATSNSTATVMK
ncbi:MAG: hypothetical protein JWR83_922 [Aeromicrobium sp.]|nr:hypothetical protein [Aeromicrobium sp.]